MPTFDPLYTLVVALEARAADYFNHGQECKALAQRLLKAQGDPDALRAVIAETIAMLTAYADALPTKVETV